MVLLAFGGLAGSMARSGDPPAGSPSSDESSWMGSRPNIVIVMPDDQGKGDLACHGHPVLRTPNLDRWHQESLRLTQFFVSPTCAPTRAALLTGRHEFKSGVTHTILERERLALSSTTLADILRQAGYSTGIFGKWHLGDEEDYQPGRRGFDESFIHGAGGIGQTYPGSCGDVPNNTYMNPIVRHQGKFIQTKGYCTDVFFEQALQWISDRARTQQPFFVMITPNAPHAPLVSPGPEYDRLYQGKSINGRELSRDAVTYFSMITNIDDNVGKLLDTLARLGIREKTLLLYLTDNGGTFTQLFSAGMRGAKGSPYEGGTRVSSFWSWPGKIAAGKDCPALAAHIDVLPTLCALAGGDLPDALPLDGKSLVPILRDPTAPWPDRYLFTHVGRWDRGKADESKYRQCAVRSQRFRLVNHVELYDLTVDPAETTNVFDKFPDEVGKMREAYDQWWAQARAGMINEDAIGPKINPYKAAYQAQFAPRP
jgi:arylsulfatase